MRSCIILRKTSTESSEFAIRSSSISTGSNAAVSSKLSRTAFRLLVLYEPRISVPMIVAMTSRNIFPRLSKKKLLSLGAAAGFAAEVDEKRYGDIILNPWRRTSPKLFVTIPHRYPKERIVPFVACVPKDGPRDGMRRLRFVKILFLSMASSLRVRNRLLLLLTSHSTELCGPCRGGGQHADGLKKIDFLVVCT